MTDKSQYRDIRNRHRFIPFGRFSLSGRGRPPYNQVLVGRTRVRANFLSRLIDQSRLGAILIAGRRGSGKTSFVRYALNSYTQEAFTRYQRVLRDRGFGWLDSLGAAAVCVLSAMLVALFAQSLSLISYNFLSNPTAGSAWLIPVLLVLLFSLLVLCRSAFQTTKAAYLACRLGLHTEKEKAKNPSILDRVGGTIISAIFGLVTATALTVVCISSSPSAPSIGSLSTQISEFRAEASISDFILICINFLVARLVSQAMWRTLRRCIEPEEVGRVTQAKIDSFTTTAIFVPLVVLGQLWDGLLVHAGSGFDGWLATSLLLGLLILLPYGLYRHNSGNLGTLKLIAGAIAALFASFIAYRIAGPIRAETGLIPLLLFFGSVFATSLALHVFEYKRRVDPKTTPTPPRDTAELPLVSLLVVQILFTVAIIGAAISPVIVTGIQFAQPLLEVPPSTQLPDLLVFAQNIVGRAHFDFTTISITSAFLLILVTLQKHWIGGGLRLERQDSTLRPLGRDDNDVRPKRFWDKDFSDESDDALGGYKNSSEMEKVRVRRRAHVARTIERASFARFYYELRAPVLVLWINLGFDDLRHARIVEAMLAQLRLDYKAHYHSLRSPTFLILLLCLAVGTMTSTRIFATAFFDHPSILTLPSEQLADGTSTRPDYCSYYSTHNREAAPVAVKLICILPSSNAILEAVYAEVLPVEYPTSLERRNEIPNPHNAEINSPEDIFSSLDSTSLVSFLLDGSNPLPMAENAAPKTGMSAISLRTYHIILFWLCALALIRMNRWLGIFPYAQRIREMEELIERVRGRVTRTVSDGPEAGFLQKILGLQRSDSSVAADPDPRIVEHAFLELLRKTGNERERKRPVLDFFEFPPEIVFVFDEMDKLSGKVDVELSRSDEAGTVVEENARDRARSLQLHQLLSDMKRLLGSNAARFIFIGNRLYHDEWLADQANRSPLLSSIFTDEIYLTSLLNDREHSYGRLNDRIADFLVLFYQNAVDRNEMEFDNEHPDRSIDLTPLEEEEFVQSAMPFRGHPRRIAMMAQTVGLHVLDDEGSFYGASQTPGIGKQKELTPGEKETLEQFLNFLTYRSGGNPKRIKELMSELVQPASSAANIAGRTLKTRRSLLFGPPKADGQALGRKPTNDWLVLDDKALYRIQFIDTLYRHLCDHIESRIMDRDDKVAMSVFYLMDFLCKFHNRGFLLTNLQRVDELSHIHRAPDLRSMMGLLVDISAERFLHRVLNGVYTYRFRSDFAREIDYLSRISMHEMAALNFTLDESQSLKGLYQQTMSAGDRENADTIAGLGELYEYDQDYEIARNYYRRAINLLDARFRQDTGHNFRSASVNTSDSKLANGGFRTVKNHSDDADWEPAGFVMLEGESESAQALIRANVQWAFARVRLMLQVGQTYEQEGNFERAVTAYMAASRFSDVVLAATTQTSKVKAGNLGPKKPRTLMAEGASLLYQARFAAAWVFEKDSQDIDESTNHVEEAIFEVYARNKVLFPDAAKNVVDRQTVSNHDANLYHIDYLNVLLTTSDLHDKAGDLYFYKGLTRPRYFEPDQLIIGGLGYLPRAQQHYAGSLFQIRQFMKLRADLSARRLSPDQGGKPPKNTEEWNALRTILPDGIQPDMVQNSLANTITDLGESILAQASDTGIIGQFAIQHSDKSSAAAEVFDDDKLEEKRRHISEQLKKSVEGFRKLIVENDFKGHGGDEKANLAETPLIGPQNAISPFGVKFESGATLKWIGSWNANVKTIDDLRSHKTFEFSPDAEKISTNDFERLSAYIFLSHTAAGSYADSGYPIDAANELLLQAQSLISLMWDTRYLEELSNVGTANSEADQNLIKCLEKHINSRRETKSDGTADDISSFDDLAKSTSVLRASLGMIAWNALQMAVDEISHSHRPSTTRSSQNRGDPAELKKKSATNDGEAATRNMADDYDRAQAWSEDPRFNSLAASLVLALSHTGDVDQHTKQEHSVARAVYRKFLQKYGRSIFGDAQGTPTADWSYTDIRSVFRGLYQLNERHRFPVLSRLETFKFQLNAALIIGPILFGEADVAATQAYAKTKQKELETAERRAATANKKDAKRIVAAAEVVADAASKKAAEAKKAAEIEDTAEAKKATKAGNSDPETQTIKQHQQEAEHASFVGRAIKEMMATSDIYKSELHFSPQKLGMALALAWRYFKNTRKDLLAIYTTVGLDTDEAKKVREVQSSKMNDERRPENHPDVADVVITCEAFREYAITHLRRAEEITGMGRAYYENISPLQYLNDDFNDRSVHFTHAQNMLRSDLTDLLLRMLTEER